MPLVSAISASIFFFIVEISNVIMISICQRCMRLPALSPLTSSTVYNNMHRCLSTSGIPDSNIVSAQVRHKSGPVWDRFFRQDYYLCGQNQESDDGFPAVLITQLTCTTAMHIDITDHLCRAAAASAPVTTGCQQL